MIPKNIISQGSIPKLSIAMIVKNEQKNLRRCLDSFLPIIHRKWCELIIVDTGSTDKTVSIAKEYVPEVHYRKWDDDFSAARNYSISKCTGERILIVDADEELKQSSLYILQRNVLNLEHKNRTTFIMLRHLYNKTNMQYSENFQQRIFPNDGQFHYESIIHNRPIIVNPEYVFSSDIIFNHYGFRFLDSDGKLLQKKTERSLPLLLKVFKESPDDFSNLTHLVKTFVVCKDYKSAVKYGEIWIKEMNSRFDKFHEGWFAYTEVFVGLVNSYIELGKIKDAERIKDDACRYSKRIFNIYLSLGEHYSNSGNIDKAVEYFETAVTLYNEPNMSIYEQLATNNVKMLIPVILNYLSIIYFCKGEYKKSGEYVNQGILMSENGCTQAMRWDIFNEPEAVHNLKEIADAS